jgi:glycosyltransferase involved in cell wall biosynthesis
MPQPPFISVIMPIRNEAEYIRRSLGAVLTQHYPPSRFEVVVVDGMSDDGTRETVREMTRAIGTTGPAVQLLDNLAGIVPPAMNIGLRVARGEVIIRVDGHCEIIPDYFRRCVEILARTGADCVGGPIQTVGETPMARAIATAQSAAFGVGGVAFRTGRATAGFVDTVAFGAYHREVFTRIGVFDEELKRNQDDEFNFRLTQAGGRIWLDPAINSQYFSRAAISSLWSQYYQYGFYKVRVIQKRGAIASWRHLVPAGFVLALAGSFLLALVMKDWRWALTVLFPYLVASLSVSILTARRTPRVLPLLPVVFATLHLSYGLGFLWGMLVWWRRGTTTPAAPAPTRPHDRRFIILTQYYPPEIGAPQARLSEMAKRMRTAGYSVTVLTAMPNYPLGHYYPGYGGWFRRETRDGIEVLRVPIYPTKRVQMMPRLSNYFSFIFTALFWGALKLPRAGYLMVESPPLFTGLAALLLAKLKGARLIFNVSDLWPDSPVRLGVLHPGLTLSLARWLERVFYRHSWLVTVQSEETLANIHQRFPRVPLHHLSNGVDLNVFTPERRTVIARTRLTGGDPDAVVAVYTGLHGLAQGLDQLLLATAQLRDLPHFRLVLIGDGPEKDQLLALKQRLHLDHVFFFDPVPQQEVPALTASADIAVIPLRIRLPGAVPSKLYEAMACGLPALVVAQGEPAHIVEETHSGIAVASGDITGLEAALRRLIADPALRASLGTTGRTVAGTRFNRNIIVDQFIQRLTNGSIPAAGMPAPPEHPTCATSSPTSS